MQKPAHFGSLSQFATRFTRLIKDIIEPRKNTVFDVVPLFCCICVQIKLLEWMTRNGVVTLDTWKQRSPISYTQHWRDTERPETSLAATNSSNSKAFSRGVLENRCLSTKRVCSAGNTCAAASTPFLESSPRRRRVLQALQRDSSPSQGGLVLRGENGRWS